MDKNSINSGTKDSVMEQTASPTSRQDIYLAFNPLTPSELEWLKQQRLRVAAAYGRLESTEAAE